MLRTRTAGWLLVCAAVGGCLPYASGENIPVVLRGKVILKDGSAPGKSVGLERVCTDNGSGPGPLTNKQGEYVWRMFADPMRTRRCFLRANLKDYQSSQLDISAVNGYLTPNIDLDPIILSPMVADPAAISTPDSAVPPKSRAAWTSAMASAGSGQMAAAESQLKVVVQEAGKFAPGWHALGVVQMLLLEKSAAKVSFEQSMAADPKFLPSYVMLARLALQVKDWDTAAKVSEAYLAADKKGTYPEALLHLSVARYQKQDLAGAETAARQAVQPKTQSKVPRAEYVLGRILLAKGDTAGAREHMTRYLQLEADALDKLAIQAFIATLEQPGAKAAEPELELL